MSINAYGGREMAPSTAALTREQLEAQLAAAEEQLIGLRFVLAIAPELHRISSAGELWEAILRNAATLLDAEHGFVAPYPEAVRPAEAGQPTLRAALGRYAEQTFADLAASVRQACDAAAAGSIIGIGTGELAIPLHVEGRVAGVAYIHARSRFAANREVLEAFAAEVSGALRNALLFAATTTDPLTGVFRRAFVLERLQQELKAAQRRAESCSVLCLDVQQFAALNEEHGRAAGDRVLQTLGAMLRLWMRDTDVIGRTGADEFLLVLPATPSAGAATVAKRLLQHSDWLAVEHEGKRLPVQLRVGAATLLAPGPDEPPNLDNAAVERIAEAVVSLARGTLQGSGDGQQDPPVQETRWSEVRSAPADAPTSRDAASKRG